MMGQGSALKIPGQNGRQRKGKTLTQEEWKTSTGSAGKRGEPEALGTREAQIPVVQADGVLRRHYSSGLPLYSETSLSGMPQMARAEPSDSGSLSPLRSFNRTNNVTIFSCAESPESPLPGTVWGTPVRVYANAVTPRARYSQAEEQKPSPWLPFR